MEGPKSEAAGGSPTRGAYYPEIVIGICAAAGTDTSEITDALSSEVRSVEYVPVAVRISALMSELPGLEYLKKIQAEDARIRASMRAGNKIREVMGENDALIRLVLSELAGIRGNLNESNDPTVPAERHCFILNSLKRAEEVQTLRKLFGQRFFLVSVFEPKDQRSENLCRKISKSRKISGDDGVLEVANDLIEIDQKERSDPFGQRLEDVFPLGDVFLKAGVDLRKDIRRFVQLLFKAPYLTPTADEFLMFHAKATSQRSADLSRQVGAVASTATGEILATGCNEVPRAGGGVNWDEVAGTEKDYRDYKEGQDSAAAAKLEIVADALRALSRAGWLSDRLGGKDPDELAQEALFSADKPLAGTTVTNLLEFGRIVHAEMAAICDAAMRGVSLKGSTLYCTTFPCHMCARHIIASGIRRVVYIEPYPKSRAKKLYRRAIQVDQDRDADADSVKFESFVGVSPSRFLDLFEMVNRKDKEGYAFREAAPPGTPKGVAFGALVSELESTYVASIQDVDWATHFGPLSEEAADERK